MKKLIEDIVETARLAHQSKEKDFSKIEAVVREEFKERLIENENAVSNSASVTGLSVALRAICLTRDYVGEEALPAIDGWEWYEAGKLLADLLDGDKWAGEFRKRVNRYKSLKVREAFKIGDWVLGVGEHGGCSEVFEGDSCDYQPFSYLDDYNPSNFRLATSDEIEQARC